MATAQVTAPLKAIDGKRPEAVPVSAYGWEDVPERFKSDEWVLIGKRTTHGTDRTNYTFQHLVDAPAGEQSKIDRRLNGEVSNAAPKTLLVDLIPKPEPDWFIEYRRRQFEENGKLNHENNLLRQRVSELERAILDHKQEQRKVTAMSIYGSENALEEMTRQVSIAPQFKDLTPEEHRFVAGVGLMSGLNPVFHLHAWHQKQWNPETRKKEVTLHILPHYTALIAASPDPIMTKARRLTPEEMRARGIPERDINEGSIAYIVEGYNLKQAIMARQAGLEYSPIVGFGWWAAMKDEEEWREGTDGKNHKVGSKRVPNDVPNGRDGEWRAKTRAERDLYNHTADLRPRFIAPEGGAVVDDEWIMGQNAQAGDVIEGEYTSEETKPVPRPPDWLTPEGEARANAYMQVMCVTDEMINATLAVKNWRETPITADEFKAVVDHEAPPMVTAEEPPAPVTMEDGEVVTIEAPAASSVEGPTDEPKADATPEPASELGEFLGPKVAKCAYCGLEDADPDSPFPTLCESCGDAEANREAKKTEKAAAKK
jgi:hypothetical protein